MFGMGPGEMIAVACIVVILFGAGKLPGVGENMGSAIANFKSAVGAPDALRKPRDEASQ